MGYFLWKLAALGLAASAQQTAPARPNIANQTFEVDVVFPRPLWETYAKHEFQVFKKDEIIPLVLAVQNLTEWRIGNNTVDWYWTIYSHAAEDLKPLDLLDQGRFEIPEDGKSGPVFLVAATNSSTWYPERSYPTAKLPREQGDTFSFQWRMGFESPNFHCTMHFDYDNRTTLFSHNIASSFYVLDDGEHPAGSRTPDEVAIPQAPHCPESNGLYHVYASPNVTETECPIEVTTVLPPTPAPEATNQGNPCAAQVDDAIASNISSRVASITSIWISRTAVPTSATPTPTIPTSTSRGFAGAACPVQTAMAAAAGLLCGFALS